MTREKRDVSTLLSKYPNRKLSIGFKNPRFLVVGYLHPENGKDAKWVIECLKCRARKTSVSKLIRNDAVACKSCGSHKNRDGAKPSKHEIQELIYDEMLEIVDSPPQGFQELHKSIKSIWEKAKRLRDG